MKKRLSELAEIPQFHSETLLAQIKDQETALWQNVLIQWKTKVLREEDALSLQTYFRSSLKKLFQFKESTFSEEEQALLEWMSQQQEEERVQKYLNGEYPADMQNKLDCDLINKIVDSIKKKGTMNEERQRAGASRVLQKWKNGLLESISAKNLQNIFVQCADSLKISRFQEISSEKYLNFLQAYQENKDKNFERLLEGWFLMQKEAYLANHSVMSKQLFKQALGHILQDWQEKQLLLHEELLLFFPEVLQQRLTQLEQQLYPEKKITALQTQVLQQQQEIESLRAAVQQLMDSKAGIFLVPQSNEGDAKSINAKQNFQNNM